MPSSVYPNLQGIKLIASANQSPPFTSMEQYSGNKSWYFTGGIEAKVLETLSKHFNFTYTILYGNNHWGSKLANGTWDGVVGNVLSGKADLGLGGLTTTKERSEAVLFTHIYLFSPVTFITPPSGLKPPVKLVLEPFSPAVWIGVIFALLLVCITQWFIIHKILQIKEKLRLNWAIVCELLRQQYNLPFPRYDSLRITFIFWSYASLILSSCYGGCLASLMAIPISAPTIDSLEELAREQSDGKIKVYTIKGSAYYTALKESESGIFKQIGASIKGLGSKDEGLELVINSNKMKYASAFISSRDYLYFGLLKNGGNAYYLPPETMDSVMFVDSMAMAVKKDFKFIKEFNHVLENLVIGGFISYWKDVELKKILYNKDSHVYVTPDMPSKFKNLENEFKPFSIEQLQSAFYLVLFGFLLAFIVLCSEIFKFILDHCIFTNR